MLSTYVRNMRAAGLNDATIITLFIQYLEERESIDEDRFGMYIKDAMSPDEEDNSDEWEDEEEDSGDCGEGRMMAGMAHGNRGLADYDGLDLDGPDECGHHCDSDCPRCGEG